MLDRSPPGIAELGREVEKLRAAAGDHSTKIWADDPAARRMREVAALYTFADKLAYADRLEQVYEAALDAIIAGLECDRASILVFDDYQVMRFVAWRGLSDQYRRAVDGHSPWNAETSNPSPIAIEDVIASDESEALKQIIAVEGIRGLAFIPLIANGRLIGKFMTYYNSSHSFEDEEIRLACTIASQIALGIERARAHETQRTMVQELQHRTNNLLTVVQAVAQQSLRGDGTLEDLRAVFESRLQALARANRKLANSNWSGVKLTELIREELEPFANRIELKGREVILGPHQTQNFSMGLHELATNAVKYGALSSPGGSVQISWEVDPARHTLKFCWKEAGGPAVNQPQKKGFGSSLIGSMFTNASFSYLSDGIVCELSAAIGPAGERR